MAPSAVASAPPIVEEAPTPCFGAKLDSVDVEEKIEQKECTRKYSAKYQSPRNEASLILEVMHDYFEIKSAFSRATNE